MKKIILGVAVGACAAMLAMPASAQWYIGAGVGQASGSNSGNSFQAGWGGVVTVSGDDNKTSWKLFGGYQFTPIWGVEAQYTDLGSRNFSATDSASAVTQSGSFNAYEYSIAGTGKYWFSGTPSGWFVHGKLGITSINSDNVNFCFAGGCLASGGGNKTNAVFGIGLGHQFNKNWSVKGGYENFGKTDSGPNGNDATIHNVGINAVYSF